MFKKNILLSIAYLLSPIFCYAECPVFNTGPIETVAKVIDGDTIHLTNGTKIRLAGINTAELGRGKRPNEPKAIEAKKLLENIISANEYKIRLEPATKPQDHYGRLIAHVHTDNGNNIQEQILRSGLALSYIYPPNLEHLECYQAAETIARQQHLGLWNLPAINANDLMDGTKGFARVQGVVQNVNRTNKSTWIELGPRLSLRIDQKDQSWFNKFDFNSLIGSQLEVRGYLYTYKDKLQIRIRHPMLIKKLTGQ